MQLERLLQSQGFGSRKECRQLIENGWVDVGGQRCEDPRADFEPAGLEFTVDDKAWIWRETVYLMLNKPPEYECSRTPQRHASVMQLLPEPLQKRGVQPVGRLDQDTTGLLLLSDDGAFIHRVSAPRQHVPKTYLACTRYAIDEDFLDKLRHGVLLHGETAPLAALHLEQRDTHLLALTIGQGVYHQVKRMIAAASNRCEGLHREAIGGLSLGKLEEGEWRYLDAADMALLFSQHSPSD